MSFYCTRYTLYKKKKKKRLKKQTKRADHPPTGGKIKVEKGIKQTKKKNTEVSKLKNVTAIPFHAS